MLTQRQLYGRAILVASSPLLVLACCSSIGMLLGDSLPGLISSVLLFLPQLVFPYSHYYHVTHEPFTRAQTIGGQYSTLYSIIEWVIIIGLVALFVRRLPPRRILLIALASIVFVTAATHVVISLMGYKFELLAL